MEFKTTPGDIPTVDKIDVPTLNIMGKVCRVVPFDPPRADAMGHACCADMTIKYNPEQGMEQLRDTMLHEVIHHMDYALGLELKERQVHVVASAMLCFLRANPAFTKWLIDS